ncbi:TPA: hypothetical protein DCZ39_00235 [Patescibacteria group bacterium]|nr:hypothetical protein [Candidatus Gracilibacteria bacterium]
MRERSFFSSRESDHSSKKNLLQTINKKMMKHRHTFNTTLGKIVGSLMTIAFSLVAFAHGQNCT